jgi:cell division protein FtsB
MSMFAWMFDRQAELQQEVAQLKEERDSLAAENARLASELVKRNSIQGRVAERMQLMSEEIDEFQRMVVNR